jgi:DNA-binding GntR family transcriptional regulator
MARHTSPSESLVEVFRRDITDGLYNPRERLVEAELARHYGVTRSAMRAALLELTSEGLVEREPHRGARIRSLTVAEGIEIAQVRRELEGLCARLAAERGTDEERDRLRTIVEGMRESFEARDSGSYLAANTHFHTMIREMARHEVASQILTQLGNLNFNRHFPMAFSAPVPSVSLEEHESVANAIIDGDGDAAERAMATHLDSLITVLQTQSAPHRGRARPALARD